MPEAEGPPNPVKDCKVTIHRDIVEEEWIVRWHHPRGYDPICACPGELEARTVASIMVFALAMFDITWEVHEEVYIDSEGGSFNKVEVGGESLDAFVAAQDLGEEAADYIKKMMR